MTLNITVFSQDRILQSSDFRLTDRRTNQQLDVVAHKEFLVQAFDYEAVVAFTGIAHTGRLDVVGWLRSRLNQIYGYASYEDLISSLREADDWLSSVRLADRWHTFIVGAFVGSTPRLTMLSTFESLTRAPRNLPSLRLVQSNLRPRKAGVVVTGLAEAVTARERESLRRLATRDAVEPTKAHEALARTNASAAARHRGISEGCYTAYLSRSGTGSTMPHGIDRTKDFLPPSPLDNAGVVLRRSRGRGGRPKPIHMGGMSFARLPRDENEHRLRMREQPNSAEVLTNFGAYLAERPGRAQEAIALCRRALAIDPSYANAQRNLGSLLWREGDLDETERLYRAAAASDPNSIYLGNLAQFLWCERQDVAQAQQYFQRAVDTQPTDGDARSKYLLFLAELGQVEEADRHLQVLLDREDHLDAHPLTRIAQYFERSADDYQQAETFYGKAIARDEGDIFALTQYAGFLLACNNIAASAHRFQQALEANPTDPELQAAVASSFTLLGQNPAKAERLFQQAIAAGVDPNVRANFAQYLILQDRDNEAIAELQELASTDLRHDARVKVLFYEYAHYPDDFPDALNELRRVPQLEGASRRWSFDRNVDRLRLKDEERSGFVSALADVLTGKQAVERLSEYSEWLR